MTNSLNPLRSNCQSFPTCSRALNIPGKVCICSDFCWRLHGFSWLNTAMCFPALLVWGWEALRCLRMLKDFQQLGQRASLLNNLLDSLVMVQSRCSLRTVSCTKWGRVFWKVFKDCWWTEGAETAFILMSPSFSECNALLFQCSRNIILIFKCYFV